MEIRKVGVFVFFIIAMGQCQAATNDLLKPEPGSRFSFSWMLQSMGGVLSSPLHAEEMQLENVSPRYSADQIVKSIQDINLTESVYFEDHLVIKGDLFTKIRNHDDLIIAQVYKQIDLINKRVQKTKSLKGSYVLKYYPKNNRVVCSGLAGE